MDRLPVVDIKAEILPPEELGIDPAGLSKLEERARSFIEAGPLPSLQIAVGRYGRLAMFAAFGDATLRSRYQAFSATKPVTHSALWMLWAEGRVTPETVVADLVPEFGTNGKEVITVEQVMCQMGGFPHAPLDPVTARDRAGRLAKFSKWRLNWEPGTASEYHPTSADWVLAEVIESVSGKDYRAFVKERVVDPLGLPTITLGVPLDQQDGVIDLIAVGDEGVGAYGKAGSGGTGTEGRSEANIENMLHFNDPAVRELGMPAAGCYSTAGDFALLYQAFLHDPYHLWKPEILVDVKTHVRNAMVDRLTDAPANLSFGLHINKDAGETSGYGPNTSADAFGWGGAGGQFAWADPKTGLSFAFFTNGLNRDLSGQAGIPARELSAIAGALALEG